MTRLLLDTHAWAWTAVADELLTRRAVRAISEADEIFISSVSLYEIGQKVRLGKWPEMEPVVDRIWDVLEQQGTIVVPLDAEMAVEAAGDPWPHRDPFDRLIAATARHLGATMVTADRMLASAPGIRVLW